ncbi:low molecular weight phosphatase family protein [Flammeovirga kamogawensis]|uniref:Protein-tyrosine-phosphatase n=1 Tax=Flammeovirga kamogawensis TaxID=373891 RepID=A0ABX8H3T5_9BACT|nr:protein-tyrosine-phosphatase [Flammeovirga kamogawensis]MBB6463495.1 arsenate reductase [Flammeovirga kamogawensis]QWG10554.1 protein-tyrosine-phosphatase [Flammeovirga kamogawensis]TRX63662.1 protein-tyrosine-phosphatase [Flammeovirga kamogawensis]
MNTTLSNYIEEAKQEFDLISEERKAALEVISTFVSQKLAQDGLANLILICTHNSRRSHLSQVWAQIAVYHYGFTNVFAYSGGTEATAMFPSAANALTRAGLEISKLSESSNPVYAIKFDEDQPAIIGFSKTYDNPFNPQNGFGAIMTCNHADANCPIIFGAERISLPFEDPKAFDGTPEQEAKYDERCRQVARELLYAFSKI